MTLAVRNIPESVIGLIPESVARENCVIAIDCSVDLLTIAFPNDLPDWFEKDRIEVILDRPIRWVSYPHKDIQSALDRHYDVPAGIDNCSWTLKYQCPHRWRNLAKTDDGSIRFCPVCSRNVFLCHTESELTYHAQAGNCVAKSDGFDIEFLGEVAIQVEE